MTDYTLKRKGISVDKSERFYKENKSEMFAISLGFIMLRLISLIRWFLAPTYWIVVSYTYYKKYSTIMIFKNSYYLELPIKWQF